jgi:hypothetical protein
MASLYNADLKPIQAGQSTHPYDHATRLFLADNFRLAPKQSFLYYVVINLDPSQTQLGGGFLGAALSFADRYQSLETGMLVKNVDLPKFTVDTKTLNAYNRKNIIQTNIRYDPVDIKFHDDAADVITNFWNDYYTYYYRDSDYSTTSYGQPYKYQKRNKIGWGFSPRNSALPNFLSSIRIFSLHNKRFTEYYLANPIITNWRHGEHKAAGDNDTLENSMTVAYETVKYFTGYVNPVSVDGFSLLHYDNTNSPISTSTTNIYSDLGILGAIDGAPRDLRKPDGSDGSGGPASSLVSMYRLYNNFKNVNLNNVVGSVVGNYGVSVINNVLNNSSNPFGFPVPSGESTQASFNNIIGNSGYAVGTPGTGVSIGGTLAGIATGAAVNATNTVLGGIASAVDRGISTATGAIVTAGSNAVFDNVNNNGEILINPSSLQPVTGSTTAAIVDSTGRVVAQIQTTATASGSFNPNNLTENLLYGQRVTDPSGQEYISNTYRDGTEIRYDAVTGNTLQFIPGASTASVIGAPAQFIPSTQDARTLAAQGAILPAGGVKYQTDPRTGLVYTVGGTTSAVITNTIAGATGAVSGLYAGQAINQALSGTFLGKSLIGRTIATSLSTVTGAAIGRAVNNGLQPIINKASGSIVQAWDDSANKVKNVVSSWTGTGGYDPSRPRDNQVSSVPNPAGGSTTIYKNGDVLFEDPNGVVTLTPGNNDTGLLGFYNRAPGVNADSAVAGAPYGSVWTDSQGTPINFGGLGGSSSQDNLNSSPYPLPAIADDLSFVNETLAFNSYTSEQSFIPGESNQGIIVAGFGDDGFFG